jgi:hypothetical protein
MTSPSRTRAPSSTRRSASRPWIFAETTALRRATTYPDAVSSAVPDGASPDLSTRGVVVSTSVAAKTPRPHEKTELAATMNTGRAMTTTQALRRERGGWSSRRSEASSVVRSSVIRDRSRAAAAPPPLNAATCLDCAPRTSPESRRPRFRSPPSASAPQARPRSLRASR